MKYDTYYLTDKATGSKTKLTVPAGKNSHKLLWGGEQKVEETQKNIKLSEAKSKNIIQS